jgi:2-dehydropantoate 2-reductase
MTVDSGSSRFAIIGAGGVGGYFGSCLARAGFDTTFIARGSHLQAIRDNGLRIEDPDETFTVNVGATADPAEIGPVDFILFAVKLWDTEAAALACKPLMGANTALVSLQNGIDQIDVQAAAVGRPHVMGGVAEVSASIAAPGVIRRVGPVATIRFGELSGEQSTRAHALAAVLGKAGIAFEHSPDVNVAMWRKFVFLVGLSASTALTRRTIGEVRGDPDTRALLQQIMSEALQVGQASGVSLADGLVADLLAYIDGLAPAIRASMANDLAAGRRLELPWLSGTVVRKGTTLGVATPANDFVCKALKLEVGGSSR